MFSYVSGANFFGEILEWWGFFLISPSLPTIAFAVFTSCNIGPRAVQHHRYIKLYTFCSVKSTIDIPFKQTYHFDCF